MDILSFVGKYLFEGLIFLLIFSVIIIIHELGHFLAARRAGVKVEEFGFGLPPKLWGKKTSRTVFVQDEHGKKKKMEETMEWTINAIPFGGFVRMLGEDEKETSADPRAFGNRPLGWKILIVSGGVLMNFLLGWVILTVVAMTGFSPIYPTEQQKAQYIEQGIFEGREGAFLLNAEKDNALSDAGFKGDDRIISFDGKKVAGLEYFIILEKSAREEGKNSVPVTIERFVSSTRSFEEKTLALPIGKENPSLQSIEEGIVVMQVFLKSVAEERGLQKKDLILSIDDRKFSSKSEFLSVLAEKTKAERNDLHLEIQKWNTEKGSYDEKSVLVVSLPKAGKLGIEIDFGVIKEVQEKTIVIQMKRYFGVKPVYIPILEAPLFAIGESWRFMVLSVDMLKDLITSVFTKFELPEGIGGPVSIAHITGKLVELGDSSRVLQFAAVLSLSLAVINIMPFPALDGGRLFFLLVEAGMLGIGRGLRLVGIRKQFPKKIPPKWETPLHGIGYLLLLALIVAVTWRDIVNIFFS